MSTASLANPYSGMPALAKPRTRRRGPKDGFETKEDCVHTVQRIWKEGRERMYPVLKQWAVNAQFFRGKHYAMFPVEGGILGDYEYMGDPDGPPDRVRLTANVCQKHLMAWAARMTRHNPRYKVFPTSWDEEDKDRADLYNKLIQWQSRCRGGWRDVVLRSTILTGIMGNCFLKSVYDPEAGAWLNPLEGMFSGDQALTQDPEIQAQFGHAAELGTAMSNGGADLRPEGAVVAKVIPPYEITYPDEHARNMAESSGILHTRVVKVRELREHYHDHPDVKDILPENDAFGHQLWFINHVADYEVGPIAAAGDGKGDETNEQQELEGTVLLQEYWGRRTRHRDKGVRIVIAGDVLLEPRNLKDLENPYWHGELPFVHMKHTDDGTSIWATCDLEQAIPVQVELNRSLSQAIEIRNRTADPLIIDSHSGINWDLVLHTAGEVLKIRRPGGKVDYLKPPQLPAYFGQTLDQFIHIIEGLFSDHKPSQGISKAGDSGVKVRALQMADEARFVPYAEGMAVALKEFVIQQLCLLLQYTEKKKIGYVVGEEEERTFFSWDRNEILGISPHTESSLYAGEAPARARVLAVRDAYDIEVHVVPGKSLNTVREDIGNLIMMGVMDPLRDRAQIMEMYGYGFEVPRIMVERRRHTALAASENDTIHGRQAIPPPSAYEDHVTHVESHKAFSNTDRGRSLPPEVKNVLFGHIQLHEELMIAEQLRLMYLQQKVLGDMGEAFGPLMMPMPGAQPGGPQQSQPQKEPSNERTA